MSENIAVVRELEAKDEAHCMGYNEYQDLDIELYESSEDFDVVTDSARYANIICPRLRALSGFADGGNGTYSINRMIALVHPADMDDRPIVGEQRHSSELYEELLQEYRNGAYTAFQDQFEG